MSTVELLESVAAELNTLPALLFEALREEEEATELVKAYGEGNASYDDVLNYLNGII